MKFPLTVKKKHNFDFENRLYTNTYSVRQWYTYDEAEREIVKLIIIKRFFAKNKPMILLPD